MAGERPIEEETLPPAAPSQAENAGETLPAAPKLPAGADAVPSELRDHPRYRIVRLLGRGGMGAVYEAVHKVMERPVALKVMRAELTDNPAAIERFRREVKAAAQLVHPNIVTAFDAEQVGNLHFLVMEYVAGRNLADVVLKEGPLPVAVAVDYTIQAARGLQHAFEKGMIHRDIKPHNLMISDFGLRTSDSNAGSPPPEPNGVTQSKIRNPKSEIVKILDFGLARFASEQGGGVQTASGLILGTVDFMAPEQADNARAADIRSDIYSLGCTLYYLLSGRVPFPEGSIIQRVMAHVEKPPPPLTNWRPDVPPGLLAVTGKMLAKKPADRYQTPAEVARALAPFVESSDGEPILHAIPILPPATTPVSPEPILDVIPVSPAVAAPGPKQPNPFVSPIELLVFLLGAVLFLVFFVAACIKLSPPANLRGAILPIILSSIGGISVGFMIRRRRHRLARAAETGRLKTGASRQTGRTLLGCFLLAALAILAVTGVAAFGIWLIVDRVSSGVGKFFDEVKQQSAHWQQIDRDFIPPPPNASDDELFPKKIGESEQRMIMANGPVRISELNLQLNARQALYARGDEQLHICVAQPVTKQDKEALYKRAIDAVNQSKGQGGRRMVTGAPTNDRITLHLDESDAFGKSLKIRAQMWWNRDWLFIVYSSPDVNPEPLMTEYLQSLMQTKGAK